MSQDIPAPAQTPKPLQLRARQALELELAALVVLVLLLVSELPFQYASLSAGTVPAWAVPRFLGIWTATLVLIAWMVDALGWFRVLLAYPFGASLGVSVGGFIAGVTGGYGHAVELFATIIIYATIGAPAGFVLTHMWPMVRDYR
jgi:hypothetical protein